MRLLFGLLCLVNLMVFLLAGRLPQPDTATPPEANMPRVESIHVIEQREGIAKPPQNP